jgi:hypothetical protein
MISKVANLGQFVAKRQNPVFDVHSSAVRCPPRSGRSRAPVDPVETLTLRPDPTLHHRERHAKRASHLS